MFETDFIINFELTQTHICLELKRYHENNWLSLPNAAADPDSVSRSATTNKWEARGIA